MKKSLRVLVYGGTGAQGSSVVRALLEKGHEPFILSRNGNKAAELVSAGAKVIIGDTSELDTLVAASRGMDAISLMTPLFTNVPPALSARNGIEAARQAGVRHIVWNTSAQPAPAPTGNPLVDHQPATTRLLEKSGLSYVTLIPTIFAENLLGPYTAPFVATQNKLTYPTPAAMSIQWTPMIDLGRLVVAALERPELSGMTYRIASTERLNGPQLAAAFSQGVGRMVTYEEMAPEAFGKILNEAFGPGAGDAIAADYQRYHEDPSLWDTWWVDTDAMSKDLGITTTPMMTWVTEYAAMFSDRG